MQVADPVTGVDGGDPDGEQQVGLAGAGSDGDRLQHLRSVLPCEVRVTARSHPLFGECWHASGFKRWNGVLLLVVELPDGSPGTVRADATDVFAARGAVEPTGLVLDGDGVQALHGAGGWRCSGGRELVQETANRFDLSLVRANDFGKVNLFARLESSP